MSGKQFILTVFLLVFVTVVSGQTYDELIKETGRKDITELLPPLSELQEMAIQNSPIFKMLDADVELGEFKVKEEQREWMRAIGFEGSVKYGLFDNLILSQDMGLNETSTSTTEQTRFSMGLYAKIPLSSIIDKSNVKTAKAEKDRLRFQRQVRIQELRQAIIIRYNKVIGEYRSLVLKQKSVENYRAQVMRAKIDFQNGKLDLAEYVRLDNMLSNAVLELEKTKVEYLTALQILEETVGAKLKLAE